MPVTSILHDLAELIYPSRCAICDADAGPGEPFCSNCTNEFDDLSDHPACPECSVPLPQHDSPCPYCFGKCFFPYHRIVAIGPFKDPLKLMIHRMKYQHRWPIAEILADWLIANEQAKGLLPETDVLVPVPLHWTRQIARGYNQAEVVARRIARVCGKRVSRGELIRIRPTATQAAIHSRAQRAVNLKNAFALIRPQDITGKHVVVVDDVMTTVATLKSVGRVLKKARPASLCAMVLAVADPRRREFETI